MLGVASQTPITYLSNVKEVNFVQAGGRNLFKAVFRSVYCELAANSIQKHVKKGRCVLSHFVIKLSHFVIPVAVCNNTCRTL